MYLTAFETVCDRFSDFGEWRMRWSGYSRTNFQVLETSADCSTSYLSLDGLSLCTKVVLKRVKLIGSPKFIPLATRTEIYESRRAHRIQKYKPPGSPSLTWSPLNRKDESRRMKIFARFWWGKANLTKGSTAVDDRVIPIMLLSSWNLTSQYERAELPWLLESYFAVQGEICSVLLIV